jgi:2-polyprenyl-6-methoxyphenol hydroxylase-like FAD-dependent oxidoreductase
MMLACELALGGARVVVVERLTAPSTDPKSNGLVGQVVRMVDRRGLFERLSGEGGPPRPNRSYFMFAAFPLDLSLLDDSPVYNVAVPEVKTVRVLEARALELGVEVRRGHEFVGFSQHDGGVTVVLRGPDEYELEARYLVGADGAHSAVRKAAGIGFPGISHDRTTGRHAHVSVPAAWVDPATGALNVPGFGAVRPFLPIRTDHGGFSYAPLPGRPPMVATNEWDEPETVDTPMTLDEMRASIRRVLGADVPIGPPPDEGPHVLRRLRGGNSRVAEKYRDGRVFLVGDAAHVFAAGGTGLNLGMQDAINLGWKLAAVINGSADVLDTYEAERRPAADRAITHSLATAALLSPGPEVTALRTLFGELLTQRDTVRTIAGLVAGADVRYPVPDGAHPLAGWPAPDLDLRTSDGTVRLAELVRSGRPLLIDLTEDGHLTADVDVVHARADTGATALLLRPDSYVVWASGDARPDQRRLADAVREWFGVAVTA